jgi:tetratricopeptide (TPR) repeat protein
MYLDSYVLSSWTNAVDVCSGNIGVINNDSVEEINNQKAHQYRNQGLWYYHEDHNPVLAIFELNNALRESSNVYFKADICVLLGNIYNNIGQYWFALKHFEMALKLDKNDSIKCAGVGYYDKAHIYQSMIITYSKLNEYRNSLISFRKSIRIFLITDGIVSLNVANCYNNMGDVYFDRNKLDITIKYYKKALNNYMIIYKDSPTVKSIENKIYVSEIKNNLIQGNCFMKFWKTVIKKNFSWNKANKIIENKPFSYATRPDWDGLHFYNQNHDYCILLKNGDFILKADTIYDQDKEDWLIVTPTEEAIKFISKYTNQNIN